MEAELMYLNIVVTVIGAIVVFWFLYESIICRLIPRNHKKIMAKIKDKSIEYINAESSMVAEFEKGNFEQTVTFSEQVLSGQPLSDCGLMYKAYALYHLKRYNEAREAFELLNTLPRQNASHMLEKIDAMVQKA
jgi:hypothetical protein